MNQSFVLIDRIEWYEHFESLEAIKKDRLNTGFLTPNYEPQNKER